MTTGRYVDDRGPGAEVFDHVRLYGERHRFVPVLAHHLGFSVTEVASLLAPDAPFAGVLALVPDLVLYYPLPTMFYVSASEPRLAERLEKGLAMAKRDGSLDELTARHFQKEIKQLKSRTVRCFVLDNPTLPAAYASEPPALVKP